MHRVALHQSVLTQTQMDPQIGGILDRKQMEHQISVIKGSLIRGAFTNVGKIVYNTEHCAGGRDHFSQRCPGLGEKAGSACRRRPANESCSLSCWYRILAGYSLIHIWFIYFLLINV